MSYALNKAFAEALGLPRGTRRAVLVLEAGELPTLTIETTVIDRPAQEIVDVTALTDKYATHAAAAIKRIRFKVRLEPYA